MESLAVLWPTEARRLRYILPALSVLFVFGQTLISFDFEVYINVNILGFKYQKTGSQKEFSIITAVERLLFGSSDDSHSYPALGLLILFWSGVWPHLKLGLLWYTLHTPMEKASRSRILSWLGFLGKFSFLDVFIVVLMISSVAFTKIMGENWACATVREGMFVFSASAILSQATSSYLAGLHRREDRVMEDGPGILSHRLVEGSDKQGLGAAVLGLAAVGLLFPAVVCPMYTLTKELNFGMGPSTTHADHSVVNGIAALGEVPAGEFGAGVLCLLSLVMVVALPLMHMLLVAVVALAKLTKGELQQAFWRVEDLSEWAALDVFLLALLPVALEMGPMTKGLPGHKFLASVEINPAVMLLGIVAVVAQHACHAWMRGLVEAQGGIETRYEPVKIAEEDEGEPQRFLVGGASKGGDRSAL